MYNMQVRGGLLDLSALLTSVRISHSTSYLFTLCHAQSPCLCAPVALVAVIPPRASPRFPPSSFTPAILLETACPQPCYSSNLVSVSIYLLTHV
ncbi:hypothetical protein P691DRAFT_800852 [Macrolepiota fuliginosa MF-IS2]|uniref:Uncharacterized protein n=1 Tax=Macrolepiota fuliginosa MF-IS2 TaxID=1400762 RepID=A0A9P5XCC4_9AGAR|nr:hypothetical protein P691DRAFT_800852 [Macrolepiota fuliginosa MF-IS2]